MVKLGMEMRQKQKRFFALTKEARKMGFHPDLTKERDKVLAESKKLEAEFDTLCHTILAEEEAKKSPKLFEL
tara:strand:+ start:1569 stop:1784 length:216 start_codon:yes stop_codon:yes gene_type:complete